MLRIALATLRHRLMGFVGAFLALALGTTMIGMMTLTLAATFGTPHPGPQRFQHARTVIAPQGFEGRPMKAPAVLPDDIVTQVTTAHTATPDRSFPVRLNPGPTGTTAHPWSSAAYADYHLTAGHPPQAPDEIVIAGGDRTLIGHPTRLATPDTTGDYRIVGVTDALWFETAVFLTDTEAQRLSPGTNALVTDQDPEQLSTLLAGHATVLTGHDLTRLDNDTTGGAQALANAQAMAGSTTGLAVFVAVFVVIATFAFATEQRRRELALMRLVGAAPRQIRRMVLGEALIIGLAAATAGCLLAPLGTIPLHTWMLDHNVAPTWFTIPLNPLPLLISFAIGLAAALAGSAATLVRVSLVRPIEVLRETTVERRVMTPLRWLLGTAMLAGAITAGTVIARTEPYLAASARKYEAVPVLYVGALTLLTPALLPPLTRLLTAPLRRSTKAGPLLVRENILTNRRRTAATVAPIVVAVGLVATLLTMQKTGDAVVLTRQQQEIHAAAVVLPTGTGIDHHTLDTLNTLPGIRTTPATPINIRIATPQGEQIDSLSATAVPPTALGTTITPPLIAGTLTSPPDNFLVIDEHAAQSNNLSVGDHLTTLLPTGTRVPTVITAIVARGLTGDDTYLSNTLTPTLPPTRIYLDTPTGTLDPQQTTTLTTTLTNTNTHLTPYNTYLHAQATHAAEQTDNAAVIILGIALAYALIAVANTLVMATTARRREFALLTLAGTTRTQITKIAAAEATIALITGTTLAAIATTLAALTQHTSLTQLTHTATTVIPWTPITATITLCTLVTLTTTTRTTHRTTHHQAIHTATTRE